jgi:hypothetical protein
MGAQTFQYYNNNTGSMGFGNRGSFIAGNNAGRMSTMNVDYNNPTPNDNPHEILSSIERVTTFMEILYKKTYRRTNQAEGVTPEWNETMSFTYNMKQEQSSLEHMFYSTAKKITMNLFDIVEESRPTQAVAEIRIKKAKFYLGSIEIPLSSLISLQKITGTFRLRRPLVVFGYTTVHQPVLSSADQDIEYKT